MSHKDLYKRDLHALRVELVKLQRHVIHKGLRILVVFEGRDAAGKDGVIKRIVKHPSPRETRVVALGKPSNQDEAGWSFQRFVAHLPVDGEMVQFNRSWYRRVGVRTDHKHGARLEVTRSLLAGIDYDGKNADVLEVDREVLFRFGTEAAAAGLAP